MFISGSVSSPIPNEGCNLFSNLSFLSFFSLTLTLEEAVKSFAQTAKFDSSARGGGGGIHRSLFEQNFGKH